MSDLTELFNRDPLELTDPDIDAIIEKLRSMRHAFNAGAATAAKPKAPAKSTLLPDLDIEL